MQDLIDAVCGWGWDTPHEVDLDHATALLAEGRALDVYASAAVGDAEALAAVLDADPAAVDRPGGPRGWAPLVYAAFSLAHQLPGRSGGPLAAVELLLARGADPAAHYTHPEHDNPFSALYGTIAVSADRPRTLALLAAGAPASDGNSTYHAVETFDLDLVQALIEAGITHEDASYTLKHALDMGFEDAVLAFLAAGADPNAVHPAADETSLHWAIKRCANARILEALFAAGADPNLRTREGAAGFLALRGLTPLDFALRLGHAEAIALCEAAGGVPTPGDDTEPLVFAVARGDETAARALLDADPGLMARVHPHDLGLLAHWTHHGRHDAVRVGLALGFDKDSTAWMGLTALHWAALRGDPVLVGMLLDAGAAAVDLGGYFGSPRHTAETCQWYAGDYDAVLALLSR
ncbi:MAG: hypothetical protein EP330_21765 [Deltaproteobacteria bacterium]|nr:MAG: hypothetical protein EP330_21765 [Deltaproteobacteria bacterium]